MRSGASPEVSQKSMVKSIFMKCPRLAAVRSQSCHTLETWRSMTRPLHNPRVFTVVRGGGNVSTEKVNTGNRGLEETEREEGGRETDRPLRGR